MTLLRDANGRALAYRLFRGGAGTALGGQAAHRDEARRIAANIVKPPERRAVRHQKLPAAFSGPARGLRRRRAIR